jgi:hypothetical protein
MGIFVFITNGYLLKAQLPIKVCLTQNNVTFFRRIVIKTRDILLNFVMESQNCLGVDSQIKRILRIYPLT